MRRHTFNRGAALCGRWSSSESWGPFLWADISIHLLSTMSGELTRMSAKLDGLTTMTAEVRHVSGRLSLLEDTNRKLTAMQGYMHLHA